MTTMQAYVASAANTLVKECHTASLTAGWWKPEDRDNPYTVACKLALIHSEISEAMEGDRKNAPDDKLPHRKMIEVELADALIRICDLAGWLDLDLGGAVVEKMAFNAQRQDHKPESRAAENGKAY
jgi:NTP pyrophosphatase (non-canonical NTP hydrolase)